MRQLLRLLTALMLLFGLCQMILAQRRGTTRYISSPNPNANNWESQMISGIMNRADIGSNTVQQPRRQRQYGRIINGRTSTTTTWSAIETISLESSTDKVPVYRVRGRNQSKLQSIESERIKSPTTGKPTRRKLYQEKQRLKTEPVSSTISSRDEFEPKTKPNPHIADNQRHTYSNLNRTATRKTTNGRRYRIRVVEGNQGNEITTKITKTATTTAAELGTKSSTTTAANDSNKTAATSPDLDAAIEEQNYPEHFKALLKSKKSPSVLPSLSTYSARSNAFILPKEQIQSLTTTVPTSPQPENSEESIITPDYIQQTESAILVSSAANEHDETVTDYYNTKTSAPAIPSTTTSKAQISTKHIGGLKFSSKLRSMNFDEQQSPIPIFRTWTTPHASTLKDPLQLISNHRYSTLPVLDAPKFSARYKSGEITSSLATYRKNLMREKPPFYTPTTPPITTQMSAKQLNEYLRNANKTDIHTKSKNVFSLAPPSSTLSSTNSTNVLISTVYRPLSLDDYDSLPSSNEVTSNENQSSSSETADFNDERFSLDPIVDSSEPKTKLSATSPKSISSFSDLINNHRNHREYITSFTTTTTTTQKPHIEKGVKIIRELVEQAKTTPQPDRDRPIQSLTTTKPIITKPAEKITPKYTMTPLPSNHKSEAETVTGRTTIQMTISPMLSSTKTMRTPTIVTIRTMPSNTRSPESPRTTNDSPIGVNDIEDLSKILKTIQSTTIKKERTTTVATTLKTKSTTTDELNFIRQVQRFLQGTSTTTRTPYPVKTTMVPTAKGITTRKPTPTLTNAPELEIYPGSRTKTGYDEPTSTFNDLLNSFQREPTTTRRPQLTTFSDADDIAFLNGLRQIAISDPNTTTSETTRNPEITKQIAQLTTNRTTSNGNSNPKKNYQNNSKNGNKSNKNIGIPTIRSEIANIAGVSVDEVEKNQNDVASLNSDLKLLSTLLGRPISNEDLPKLTNRSATIQTTQKAVTVRTTKTVHDVDSLQKIIQNQIDPVLATKLSTNNDDDKVLASIDPAEVYGKTNDALLATLLKQRGIGPAHNAIPLNIYSSTTTLRPFLQSSSRSPRPLLDGLRWLWQTWQETAPGNGGYQPQSSRTRTRGLAPNDPNIPNQNLQSSETIFDDGLDPDLSSQPLDQSYSNENGGFGFGSGLPGGQLLSTALGMTRAVTQFLGTALQGAGKTIQTAWSTQSFGSASAGGDYFRLSG